MKQPRKPKRSEKIFLSQKGLKAENWMVLTEDKESIVFIHKGSRNIRKYEKTI